MLSRSPSVSLVALALVTMVVAASPAAAGPLSLKSVGEIFVDGQGLAQGQNLVTRVGPSERIVGDFRATGLATTVFDGVSIDGFSSARPEGIGTPTLSMTGPNAKVLLHDNLHSVLEIEAAQPVNVRYDLADGVVAAQEGARGGMVRLMQGGATLGHLVAVGAEGARTRGEAIVVGAGDVTARLQSGSTLLFVAKVRDIADAGYHDAIIGALADGALAAAYVTEFEGSAVKTSEIVTGEGASIRTSAGAAIETILTARGNGPTLLVYELAYETLPAKSADDVAVYVDGELAKRVEAPRDVLAQARDGASLYYAASDGGRTRIIAAGVGGGEHRVVVAVGAQAATERQGRAESDAGSDARVYGSFEHHENGKLTGEFVAAVLPDGRATLLGLTAIQSRTEVFRNLSIAGGASARFTAIGDDEMRITTATADLTLVDDAHATLLLHARAPTDARYELAPGVDARRLGDDVVELRGPHGPAGSLVLVGDEGSLTVGGAVVHVHLETGASLLYRASPDEHASEEDALRAIADGRLGAQLLAGVHEGALVTKATTWSDDARATIAASADGALLIGYAARAEAFALDVRGGALAAQAADDLRVLADGVELSVAASAAEALESGGSPRYHAATTADGALRVIVHAMGEVRIESRVASAAREHADADAFGAFRVFDDGNVVGDYVTLKADKAAGAIAGLGTNGGGQVFASLAAGRGAFDRVAGDGARVLTVENEEARIEVADSTNALTKIVALAPTDAAFRLAAGLHAEARGHGVVDIVTTDGEHVASLVASRAALLAVRAEGDVRASLAVGGELVFRTHDGIESELSAAQRAMMNEAIAGGRVAGQVVVHGAEVAESEYGDITMHTEHTRGYVAITIDAASEQGRTLIVSLDPETIPGMARGKASIRMDGRLAQQASSYADILDATDDGRDVAEYFVLAGDAGTQVLVSVPHFSVHTVTLEQDDGEPANTILLAATILLGIVVVVQSIFIARKRRASSAANTERRP